MPAIYAKWKNGRVVVDEAVDWPEECELEVRLVAINGSEDDDVESNDPALDRTVDRGISSGSAFGNSGGRGGRMAGVAAG